MIYGWHSGTVEPPEPLHRARAGGIRDAASVTPPVAGRQGDSDQEER